MYIMPLNLVHNLKCETNLILLSTPSPSSTFVCDVLGRVSESLSGSTKFQYPRVVQLYNVS